MATYCTRADLDAAFGAQQITQLAAKNQADPDARIGHAIAWASTFIDRHLGACYVLPLAYSAGATYAPAIREWAIQLARYWLFDDVQLSSGDGQADHEARRRFEDIRAELGGVCAAATLLDNAGVVLTRTGAATGSFGVKVASRTSCLPADSCPVTWTRCGC